MFLRFAAPAGAVAAAAEQSRTNGAMLSARPARVLLMLARCTRSASAPVRLPRPPIRRTRPRSSPTTCWHLMRKQRRSAAPVRAECYGSSTKVDNHRFTVVGPCYELTTLLRRTLIYLLGRSGRARRDMGGQPNHSTLYVDLVPKAAERGCPHPHRPDLSAQLAVRRENKTLWARDSA